MSSSANPSRPSQFRPHGAGSDGVTDARRIAALALPHLLVLRPPNPLRSGLYGVVGHLGGTALASLAVGGTVISFWRLARWRAQRTARPAALPGGSLPATSGRVR